MGGGISRLKMRAGPAPHLQSMFRGRLILALAVCVTAAAVNYSPELEVAADVRDAVADEVVMLQAEVDQVKTKAKTKAAAKKSVKKYAKKAEKTIEKSAMKKKVRAMKKLAKEE